MKTYPIMLNLSERLCVVVGAGPVGLRRAGALAQAGAAVRVIDPDAPESPRRRGIVCDRRPYHPAQLAGAVLVFACTHEPELNQRIAADARAVGALVNVADDPGESDFFAAAAVGEGDVVVAVGTGGSSPALAARLKQDLAAHLPERIGEFAAALAQARRHVHQRTDQRPRRRDVLKKLAGRAGYKAFLEGGPEALLRLAEADLEKG